MCEEVMQLGSVLLNNLVMLEAEGNEIGLAGFGFSVRCFWIVGSR